MGTTSLLWLLLSIPAFVIGMLLARWQQRRALRRQLADGIADEARRRIQSEMLRRLAGGSPTPRDDENR